MDAFGREPRSMEEKSYVWIADMWWEGGGARTGMKGIVLMGALIQTVSMGTHGPETTTWIL
jgi:hypothetical protein